MNLNLRFDIKKNIESINGEKFPLGMNLINFISWDIENILNDSIIASLSKKNCKEIISKITNVSKNIIIPEIIYSNILIDLAGENIDVQQIKKDLTEILRVYNKFKEIIEFCYFNNELEDITPFQKFIYYLHKFEIEEIILPRKSISSFGIKNITSSDRLLKNDNFLIILKENSPFFYFNYNCSNIDEYLTVSFLKLIENDYLILKCENCAKYFIAYNRKNTSYCDRISPQNALKKCSQYGKERKLLERTKNGNDWYSLYRKVYQTFQKKAIRNPDHKESKKNFDKFRAEADIWKKALKTGEATEDEFVEWLLNSRNKK